MESGKKDIRSMSEQELRDFFSIKGLGAYRGSQVHQWLWQKGAETFDEMTSLSRTVREELDKEFFIPKARIPHFQQSSDGTIKNAIELPDGLIVESVLIPADGRTTLCVSCQVGCAMGCAFCATARLKRTRDLTAGEIYDQVLLSHRQSMQYFTRPLSNIVFMGMGEPTMNYSQVMRAIELITSDKALGMSPRRITVSTVGNARMIRRMADDGARFHLAVSLHWAIQEKRATIMPIAQSVPLDELLDSLNYWYSKTKSRITLEYVIWKGLNDRIEDVKALIAFARRVPSKVNLIEYNDIGDSRFSTASPDVTQMYIDALEAAGITTVVRYSKGRDIDAACGQLAGRREKKE
jgi:23S rRNA (adenine2503-C2)-methyltransferase